MTVEAATAAYEAARAAYLRAGADLRAAIEAEACDIAGELPPDVRAIVQAVAAEFGVEVCNLLGRSRRREHAEPRFAILALGHHFCELSQTRLAGLIGRHHGMIQHSLRAFSRLCESDPIYRARIARVRATLAVPAVPPAPTSDR